MRTLVLSDIHLGNGQGYDIFAGADALPALLDAHTDAPTRVFFNGDSVDFLMNEDPLELDVARAVGQAKAIVASPDARAVFSALGRVLASGGEAVIRLGNHDVELYLPEVQAVFRDALGQPADVASRLVFQSGEAPTILELGGAKLLLAHGEHTDPWNRIDYATLGSGKYARFAYPPGSRLVKTLLNPLKRSFGMRFADLVKPDFQGGALTALAVDATALKTLFQGSTAKLVWQLLRRVNGPASFVDDEEDADNGLAARVDDAGLDDAERDAIENLLAEGDGPLAFGDDPAVIDSALLKLARSGLRLYAGAQRQAVGDAGERFWSLEPEAAEWDDARRLAKKYDVQAVLFGHTHAARWRHQDGLAFVNTGTWIWLMGTPPQDAPVEAWEDFLLRLRKDPGLNEEAASFLRTCFTGARLEADPNGGACVTLFEWTRNGDFKELGSGTVGA